MTASAAQRRRTAHAAARAAKERRQRIILIVLLVGVVAVLAWELPGLLKRVNGSSSSPTTATPAPVPTAPVPHTLPKRFKSAVSDPFVIRPLSDGDSHIGPAIGRDPFSAPPTAETPSSPVATPQVLPEQIVIGTPSGKGSTHGWIVILASIPTRDGQASALAFARAARRNGIASVSVLNSSNRRPLRGGYWVVYTGPVATITQAEQLAAGVHSGGYSGAYVRELIVYRS
jgi:SPOR domain